MFDKIINPNTKEIYSIFSNKGRSILSKYLKSYKIGKISDKTIKVIVKNLKADDIFQGEGIFYIYDTIFDLKMKIFEIGYMENKKGIIQIIKDNRILENNESLIDLDSYKEGEIQLNIFIRPDLL